MDNLNRRLLSKALNMFKKKIIINVYRQGDLINDNNVKCLKKNIIGNISIFGDDFDVSQSCRASIHNTLYFNSYSKLSSNCFNDFLSIVKTENLQVNAIDGVIDLKDFIFNRNFLFVENILIDDNLIELIENNFNDLIEINFSNCNIADNCHFSKFINKNIRISNCVIDDFSAFNCSNNSYKFSKCRIDIKKKTELNSLNINFTWCDIDFRKLFLMASAKELKEIMIHSEDLNNGDQLGFISFFSPNIEKITINSDKPLKSLDFLIPLKKIVLFDINAGEHEGYYDYGPIIDSSEYDKLARRNAKQIEIKNILFDGEISLLDIANIEIERIAKLNEFYKRIMVSRQEGEALKRQYDMNDTYYRNYVSSDAFVRLNDGYYKLIYDALEPANKLPEIDDIFVGRQELIMIENLLGIMSPYKKIVNGLDYLLYIDGRPILFDKEKNYTKRLKFSNAEEAFAWRKSLSDDKHTETKLDTNYFLDDAINNIINIEDELSKSHMDISMEVDESNPFPIVRERQYNSKEVEDLNFSLLNDSLRETSQVDFDGKFANLLYERMKDIYGDKLDYFYKYIDAYFKKQEDLHDIMKKYDDIKLKIEDYIKYLLPKVTVEEGICILKAFYMYDLKVDEVLNAYGYNIHAQDVSIESIANKYGENLILLYNCFINIRDEYDNILNHQITIKKEDIKRLKYAKRTN